MIIVDLAILGMDVDEFLQTLVPDQVLFATGKGAVGKSTVMKQIQRATGDKFQVISSDMLIRKYIFPTCPNAYDLYRDNRPDMQPQRARFVELFQDTVKAVRELGKVPIVEGSIRDPELLARVCEIAGGGSPIRMIYIRPDSIETYSRGIVKRATQDVQRNTARLGYVWAPAWGDHESDRERWKKTNCACDDFIPAMEAIAQAQFPRIQEDIDVNYPGFEVIINKW